MQIFDSDYYKTYLEPGMDEAEFKKRLIVALEAEQRIDPAHFQAICDGKDEDFISYIKEEYKNSLLSGTKKETSPHEDTSVFDSTLWDDELDVTETEKNLANKEVIKDTDIVLEDAIQKELLQQEKIEVRKERAKKSRKEQERYRLEAAQRETQYRNWQASLPKGDSYETPVYTMPSYEKDTINASYDPIMSVPNIHKEDDSYQENPSYKSASNDSIHYETRRYDNIQPSDTTPYSYDAASSVQPIDASYRPTPQELYKTRWEEDYESNRQKRKEQIADEMDSMRARYYERLRAYETYESINQGGHFSFDKEKNGHLPEQKHIPYNVYAEPYLTYERAPYFSYPSSSYPAEPSYQAIKEQRKREQYEENHLERLAALKTRLADTERTHFESQQSSEPNFSQSRIPYNVMREPSVYAPHIYQSASYSPHSYDSYAYKYPKNLSYRFSTPNLEQTPYSGLNNRSTRVHTAPNPEILARKASRLEERYHALYSSDSGFKQKMAALTRVTGYTRLSNRAQMEFARYMRSSMSSGDETGDALRAKYLYGEKIRLGIATGSMIATHAFMAGQKSHIYDVAFKNKLKTELKNIKHAYKGQGSGFTLGGKLSNAEHTLTGINRRIAIVEKMDGGSKKYADYLAGLQKKKQEQESFIKNLKSGLKTKREIYEKYWKDRDALSDLINKNKKDLRMVEKKFGIGSVSTSKIKKEIKILLKKKKLGLLSAAEQTRLEQLKIGLAVRKYRLSRNERINSRKNALSYVYYAFRGNSSFDDASGLHGAVRTADFAHNYYVRKTVASFYKATRRIMTVVKKAGKATSKYIWKKAIQTPMGACVDGSILLAKAKANLLKEATKRFTKRQIMTAANTKVGIGLKMHYVNLKKKYTTSVRFVKRWADRGGKVLKVVQAPFKYIMKAFRFVKNLVLKAVAIVAGVFLFILLLAIIVDLFGASISVIFAPNVNEDGLVDLTEYIDHLEKVQEDYVKDIEDILDKDYTRIYRNYSYEDNTKEILCMMAVRMDQNLGTVYHDSTEKDECDELFRGQCRGHRDDLDYIELLYDLSHVVYIEESASYYCETLDCDERMVTIPVGEEMGRGPTTKMEKYCPGNHVDVTITTQVLRFDEIFSVDTVDSEGEITAKKGESLGKFTVTAYCDCEKCCGENASGKTATGVKPKENRTIAVDPSVIPLGTVVIINGQTYVAEDTGGAIKGNRIDIYFKDHEDAVKWGKKTLTVYLGTDVGVKDNDTTGESSWEGWTEENREWAKSLYDSDWEDLYVGYKTLKLDYSGLGIEIEEEDFKAIKEILDSKIGCPYVWGATGPDTFDCSGLVMYVYEKAGLYDWGGERPTTKTLYQECVPITKAEAKQGDLVLWDIPGEIHHVGIYCGNDIVCHAPETGDVVKYSKLWGNYGFFRLPEQ